jgi:hypothetical protein
MSEQNQLIGAYLTPEQFSEFKTVQRYYGIRSNSDAVRFLIRQELRRIHSQPPGEQEPVDKVPVGHSV